MIYSRKNMVQAIRLLTTVFISVILCHSAMAHSVTKEQMHDDGIVRLSKIEVYPQYRDEYIELAKEVGEISLLSEAGVLAMYAMAETDNPCLITILEIYSSQAAYRRHIESGHFKKYKRETLHMVKSLELCDQTPLNPRSEIANVINAD
ncbi:MAG: antibiotic biosynthesis monooxygenase [Muribaculaceae bacterium]|nr:antibiotic biosynthesis monooxygenase [Muribaculaceae bacterium]